MPSPGPLRFWIEATRCPWPPVKGPNRKGEASFDNRVISLYMIDAPYLKPIIWLGSSRRDLGAMPGDVRARMGYALYVAQQGEKHRDAKPLKGFGGAAVVEIVTDRAGDTFRCIYTVRLAGSVYVLHAFQKKSKSGRATPRTEIRLIEHRLREAERLHEEQRRERKKD